MIQAWKDLNFMPLNTSRPEDWAYWPWSLVLILNLKSWRKAI